MIKVLIIDDEPLACALIREYLEEVENITVVATCHDGFEGVKAIAQHQPDLIFLDVQMPKITGFEMLELLDEQPAVIFTTAFDEYAIRAFDSSAIDYLLKPFSKDRFDKALAKYFQQANAVTEKTAGLPIQLMPVNRVVIKDGSKIRIIPYPDIVLLEAYGDYVKIKAAGGSFLKKKTMQQFEEILPTEQFVRIHRSYIVNIAHIVRIEPYEKNGHAALLKDNTRIAVSRTGYQRIKQLLDL